MMDKQELESRTKRFAVNVIRFVNEFGSSAAGRVIGDQLLKSGTSIGANYREANRAYSRRDFVHKITIAEKEASETAYWLEICAETALGDHEVCNKLAIEAGELLAIFTSIGRSVRANDRKSDPTVNHRVSEVDSPGYSSDLLDIDIVDLIPNTVRIENDH